MIPCPTCGQSDVRIPPGAELRSASLDVFASGLCAALAVIDEHLESYRALQRAGISTVGVDDGPAAREIATAESIRAGVLALIKGEKS